MTTYKLCDESRLVIAEAVSSVGDTDRVDLLRAVDLLREEAVDQMMAVGRAQYPTLSVMLQGMVEGADAWSLVLAGGLRLQPVGVPGWVGDYRSDNIAQLPGVLREAIISAALCEVEALEVALVELIGSGSPERMAREFVAMAHRRIMLEGLWRVQSDTPSEDLTAVADLFGSQRLFLGASDRPSRHASWIGAAPLEQALLRLDQRVDAAWAARPTTMAEMKRPAVLSDALMRVCVRPASPAGWWWSQGSTGGKPRSPSRLAQA